MKKKYVVWIAIVVLVAITAGGLFYLKSPGYALKKKAQSYEKAVNVLAESKVAEDGSYVITKELLTALENVTYTEPKNFIVMIGDGMGFNIVEAARRVFEGQLYEGMLAMNYMPVQAASCTYSASDQITDSAAGATAIATGFKTTNKVIGMDKEAQKPYKTLLELAAEKGKSTGIISTEEITEATPAAFVAHVGQRSDESEIAGMQLEKFVDGSLDLAMGGGSLYYQMAMNEKLVEQAKADGMTLTTSWEETTKAKLPLAGLFAVSHLDTLKEATPTVAEMTELALELLGEDEAGFFLMVEGAQIDNYEEYNAFKQSVKEVYDFDCAVAVAMKYVAMHPDTVLIVTADHETGGVTLPEQLMAEELGDHVFATKKHTYEAVPVYAVGYGTEHLLGINENTDLGIFVAELMGETEFGAKSTLHMIAEEEEIVSFEASQGEYVVSLKDVIKAEKITHARAVHVAVKNIGDTTARLPILKLMLNGEEYKVEPHVDYIKAGAKITVSYALPNVCWEADVLSAISELIFSVEGACELGFSELQITERALAY